MTISKLSIKAQYISLSWKQRMMSVYKLVVLNGLTNEEKLTCKKKIKSGKSCWKSFGKKDHYN